MVMNNIAGSFSLNTNTNSNEWYFYEQMRLNEIEREGRIFASQERNQMIFKVHKQEQMMLQFS